MVSHPGVERRQGERRRSVGLGREIVVTCLLAAATVGSAWNAFQAARWGGVQAIHYGDANAERAEAQEAATQAASQRQIDVQTFLEWMQAKAERREDLALFLETRFRPEFRVAFEAWRAEPREPLPDGRPVPPGTPFERAEYRPAARARAVELDTEALRSVDAARVANSVSTASVANVVLFAAVLAFTGVASKLEHPVVRRTLLVLAFVTLAGATVATWLTPRGSEWAYVP